MTTFYCLRFETSPTWRARSPYLYPPGTGWPDYTLRHWVPVSSPPTTRRATMEVFDPVSTRASRSVESYILGTDPQRTLLATPLLVLRDVFTQSIYSNGCTRHISYRDNTSIVACGHYLATAVSLAPQFLLSATTSQYLTRHIVALLATTAK
jgi:hypothetical protein